MPTYTLENIKTGAREDMMLTISKKEQMVESGEWKQVHTSFPEMISQHGSTAGKTSGDWRDLLKKVKKGAGRKSTMDL